MTGVEAVVKGSSGDFRRSLRSSSRALPVPTSMQGNLVDSKIKFRKVKSVSSKIGNKSAKTGLLSGEGRPDGLSSGPTSDVEQDMKTVAADLGKVKMRVSIDTMDIKLRAVQERLSLKREGWQVISVTDREEGLGNTDMANADTVREGSGRGRRQRSRTGVLAAPPSILLASEELDGGVLGDGTVMEIGSNSEREVERRDGLQSACDISCQLRLGIDAQAHVKIATLPMKEMAWSLSLLHSDTIAAATEHLKGADARLRVVIERHNQGPKFERCSSCFAALTRSIVFQQLATKAASAVYARLVILCGGADCVTPQTVAGLTALQLRESGISGRKASYLHDLAHNFLSGALSDDTLLSMEEDALMVGLTAVKGIGVWSAHMFMIFWLHKADVLPVGDLAVRKGFQKLYQLKALPSPPQMEELAACWQPYRSLGAWYMWRLLDMTLPFPPPA